MNTVPPLDAGLGGLHVAHPARVVPFLAEGEVAWVRGLASRPGVEVGRGPDLVATVRCRGLSTAANIVAFPGLVRRDFPSAEGSVVETVLAAPTLPLVVVQWAGGATLLDGVEVILHGVTHDQVSRSEHGVLANGADGEIDLQLAPAAGAVTVDAVEGGVRLVLRADAGDPVSLVLAIPGGSGRASSVAAAARHAASHAVRAARGPTDGLLLRSGLTEVDEAVEWLRARLAGQVRRLHPETPVEMLLVTGLAASSVGDQAASEAAVRSAALGSMTRALLAARHGAVFGETTMASECARVLVESGPLDPTSDSLSRLAATELADALHLAGDPGTIAALRDLSAQGAAPSSTPASTAGERSAHSGGGRSLPMARGRSAPTVVAPGATALGAWLRGVLNGAPDAAPPPGSRDPRVETARRAAADFRTAPDDAWVRWRTLLSGDAGPGGVTTIWDDVATGSAMGSARKGPAEAGDPVGSLTAELLLTLTAGILGLRADAAAGRIRLAPVLPRHLTFFGVSGIVVGRGSVALTCSVTDESVSWELTPERGPVPPLMVFEPSVEGRVESVLVDGEAADLDLRAEGGRTVVPVQLPLDAVRTVEIRRTTS